MDSAVGADVGEITGDTEVEAVALLADSDVRSSRIVPPGDGAMDDENIGDVVAVDVEDSA